MPVTASINVTVQWRSMLTPPQTGPKGFESMVDWGCGTGRGSEAVVTAPTGAFILLDSMDKVSSSADRLTAPGSGPSWNWRK